MSSPLAIDARQAAIVRETLLKHLPVDTTVYVYGSRAKGQARRMSDLDLALCAQNPIPSAIMADLAEAFDESDLPWKVDLIDWATTSDRFRAIIAPDLRVLVPGRLTV
jgi:predicted nucleotidyltransferase